MLVVSEAVVQHILQHIDTSTVLRSIALTLRAAFKQEGIDSPARLSVQTARYNYLFMPCAMSASSPDDSLFAGESSLIAVKNVALPQWKSAAGLPATTLLFDDQTGAVKACINASLLTGLRTA
jgi:ornithine cyclodeaminase/alanine dehydrogenase-like protein (mu-crystallin family)